MVSDNIPVIEVEGLTARFGDDTILADVSFQVFKGEILVILGGSGCGKSTLLKHMIGLYRPYAGQVLINGVDVNTEDEAELRRLRMGYRGALPVRGPVRLHDPGGKRGPAPAGIHRSVPGDHRAHRQDEAGPGATWPATKTTCRRRSPGA